MATVIKRMYAPEMFHEQKARSLGQATISVLSNKRYDAKFKEEAAFMIAMTAAHHAILYFKMKGEWHE